MMIANADAIDADQLRLRHEFLFMPGLVLTTGQVARLLAVRLAKAEELVASLQAEGFLMQTPRGTYRRTELPMS